MKTLWTWPLLWALAAAWEAPAVPPVAASAGAGTGLATPALPTVLRTYAQVELVWESLTPHGWQERDRWRARLAAGQAQAWDRTVKLADRTERVLLSVAWTPPSPIVDVHGGYARVSGTSTQRVHVSRRLGDADAWVFGVPDASGMAGHRVNAHVRLETVEEPKPSSLP